MKNTIAAATLCLLAASPAMAWNPLKDAAKQVQQDVTQQAEQTAADQSANATATANAGAETLSVEAKRKALGDKAKGKSDEEVNALFDQYSAKGKDLLDQAAAAQADGGAALKESATEQATETTQKKTQEATQKGFDKLNKALGQ